MVTKKDLHYRYWIIILIAICILITSSIWYNAKEFNKLVTFALTLSSFVLALIAIYFTINFNSIFSTNVNRFIDLNEKSEKATSLLTNKISELKSTLYDIPTSIKNLEQKIDAATSMIEEKDLAIVQSKLIKDEESGYEYKNVAWDTRKILTFFIRNPYYHMAILYFIPKLYNMGVILKMDHIITKIDFIDLDSFISFCSVGKSLQLFDMKVVENSIIIPSCNKDLRENIDGWYNALIDYRITTKRDKEIAETLISYKGQIDAYLESLTL